MKIKKSLSLILSLVMLVTGVFGVGITAFADEPRYFQRGVLTDGTNTAYWVLDKDNKILYLSGDGVTNAMTPDYPSAEEGPFAGRTDVTRIVIEEDVAYVGAYVFANMTAVDTIEIQSNLLKSENSINTNAFSGDTGIRNVQGDSEVLSTNTLINAVKVGVGVFTGDWVGVVSNIIHTGSDVLANDNTLDDESVDAMVNDYIMTGEMLFLGDMDDVIEGYEERMANPCYTNNAFNHTYTEQITSQPTCTENGTDTFTCSVCGDVLTESIPALGHNYVEDVFLEPTCTKRGVMEEYCTVCGDSSFAPIPALGHTEVIVPAVAATCTSTGHTQGKYCSVCGETLVEIEEIAKLSHDYAYTYNANADAYTAICDNCHDTVTEFDNDISALLEAEKWYNSLDAQDYTADSYAPLYNVAELHSSLEEGDTLAYPQFVIDNEISSILTKITMLEPYLDVKLEAENATVTSDCEDEVLGAGTRSVVFGSYVTFTVTPDSGYRFVAWYDVNTKRYLSTDTEFTYFVTSNLYIKAIIVDRTYSTLTFRGEGGQVIDAISMHPDEWTQYEGEIDEIVPKVPYKYGYTNGRWVFQDRDISDLEIGRNIDVYAEYDEVEVDVPALPALTDINTPALTLTYVYDNSNNESVGTLIMAANIPSSCRIETIGIAYIKKAAGEFDPTEINLTLNNKVTTARFPEVSDSGLYILNIRNLSTKSNWAVKGYFTYVDNKGNLRIAYSNQINIVNRQSV